MIVEGIVTTLSESGEVNVAPMGPLVDEQLESFVFRPFQTSTTYQNLKARPCGVFHIVDDVLLIAEAALNRMQGTQTTFAAHQIPGRVLADCCRWYEFEVVDFDDKSERTSFSVRIVYQGRLRDMFGFNRAKHAVLEATILATRLHLIPEADVRSQLAALQSPVQKTAGPREQSAFELVQQYVDEWYSKP
ncbi:DUF447 domain-containing protein [Schlesneria sp. DSM 10557]|uniref:DUF447 domain-containing protein n=1 Tax=Schlesneria sp. DSM 10557 TaxID=3044399 RepID=UPI00359FD113